MTVTAFIMLVAMLGPGGESAATTDSVVYRVASTRAEEVPRFELRDDAFIRAGSVPAVGLVGSQVVEVSDRGYVLVRTSDGDVWVDKLAVNVTPKLPLRARCLTSVSTLADTTNAIVRGATEGCR